MIEIKAIPTDQAKGKIEDLIFARMAMVTDALPAFFILTYNPHEETMQIHGANTVEELNLTMSYFPDSPVLATLNTRRLGEHDDSRDDDTILDLINDPVITKGLDYKVQLKQFMYSESELVYIADRDGHANRNLRPGFKEAGQDLKLLDNTDKTNVVKFPRNKEKSRSHLRLVIDHDI